VDININTPALLFPAISLVMLAYTNRFLAIASLARRLHDSYEEDKSHPLIKNQIRNLRFRLRLVRQMQLFGLVSFLSGILSMYLIYIQQLSLAHITFGISMVGFTVSLLLSLLEIWKSTDSVELQLSDMSDIEPQSIMDYIRSIFRKK